MLCVHWDTAVNVDILLVAGVLTPEEFLLAGENLVRKCPTWSWEAGDKRKAKSFLPAQQQYLITRNVPCQQRVAAFEAAGAHEVSNFLAGI